MPTVSSAQFRFYGELNDFLSPGRRQVTFAHSFDGHPSVKDTIEALGVPHPEVDLLLVNGESVDFTCQLADGDRVSVYPVFESIDVTPVVRVRPRPLRETRFVLDTHLGRLAGYLRLLGFDAMYRNDFEDEELARLSGAEHRILLTRDRGLLKRSVVTHGFCVRSPHPQRQLAEVLRRCDLFGSIAPFTRCMRCNGELEAVRKEDVADRLLARTREHYHEFWVCRSCRWLYWRGSHYDRLQRVVEHVLREQRIARDSRSQTG